MTKDEFLTIAESYYPEIESLNDVPDFYDYEKILYELWIKMGRECMEKQLNEGSVTNNRRKKKR